MHLIRATGCLLRSKRMPKFSVSNRGAQIIDDDWKPGPYPRTQAERLAAAKKYNLLPEEYEPYDPEKWEMAAGDYPHLPNRNYEDEDPYHAFDIQGHRRNYGSAVHYHFQIYQWYYPSMRPNFYASPFWILTYIGGTAVAASLAYWIKITFERVTFFKPMQRSDRPWETHYHYPNSKIEMYE